jgi:hypothetical protein
VWSILLKSTNKPIYDLNDSAGRPSSVPEGRRMTTLREHEIERRLEQSKRLLKGAADPTTTERIGKMIGELEREIQLDKEK